MASEQELKNNNPLQKEFQTLLDQDQEKGHELRYHYPYKAYHSLPMNRSVSKFANP